MKKKRVTTTATIIILIFISINIAIAENPIKVDYEGTEIQSNVSSQKNEVNITERDESIRQVVASLSEANATLYAVKRDGYFEDFKLVANGSGGYFPFWRNVTNPAYAPKLFYNDINGDGKKDLIIVLTLGYGTGFLNSEAHVFQKIKSNIGEVYQEVLVDNPKAILLKNVKTKLTPHEAEVTIGNKKTIINIEKMEIKPENLFTDIYFGNIISFDVVNNELKAAMEGQISPAGFIGAIEITYEFKDKMYQAKKVQFNH